MKGLMKYLSPFAPDISGAAEVLFKMGGLIVIIDAGGCTGNVCGFDEPRWSSERSAIFSAGLRDLDAILGRDEQMMKKIGEVLDVMRDEGGARFLALVGTPVPSVIATDYRALRRMGMNRFGIPTVTVQTTGMDLYDRGQEKAYLALLDEFMAGGNTERSDNMRHAERFEDADSADHADSTDPADFADPAAPVDHDDPGFLGILGATPMDLLPSDSTARVGERAGRCGGPAVRIFGESAEDFRDAASFRENLVVSPSGLAAAKRIRETAGVPFRVSYPLPDGFSSMLAGDISGRRVLIIHQAVLALTIREELLLAYPDAEIDTATFFMPFGSCRHLAEEDDFIRLVQEGRYDLIIADPLLRRACRGYAGEFKELSHFAVSGNASAG